MAMTFGRWRGSGIGPLSGGSTGRSAAVPSPDGAGAAAAELLLPSADEIVGGLIVGLGQAKFCPGGGGALESGAAGAAEPTGPADAGAAGAAGAAIEAVVGWALTGAAGIAGAAG